ncbi:MAG: flagellar hook-length control protein FliK [Clostridium argentinense]|uniref:Flagellar hook-length control protein FliK n=1 Tax=Clostridium faecium TaxID=2762223 RepID=A0ABR8YQB8_9CLOT|nr:flagellar hook-length control protein FliK [Clostridium faecium]MBD8046435.1 flagellar hook-length control protein FliK [Clostridium faecium]MBS5825148.1 flagellar hook-length control protein FliK [Clostridium argentinense]
MNSVSSNTLDVLQNQMKTSGYNNSAKSKESKKESKVTKFEKAFQKVSEPLKKKTNSLQDKMVVKEELLKDIDEREDDGLKNILNMILNMLSSIENNENSNAELEGLIENIKNTASSPLDLLKLLIKGEEILSKNFDLKTLVDDNNLFSDNNLANDDHLLKDILLKFISEDKSDENSNLNINKLEKTLTEVMAKLEKLYNSGIVNDNSNRELLRAAYDKGLTEEILSKLADTSKAEVTNANLEIEISKELNGKTIGKKDTIKKEEALLANNTESTFKVKEEKVVIENQNNKNDSNKDLKKNLSSEEKILEKLIGDKEDGKLAKVNQFMNVFNSSKASLEGIKSVDKLLVNKATFSEDIVKSIRFMEVNNIKDLTVKINPKHLGEVIINLTMDQENMKAQLKAVNKDTIALLNANLKDITEKLNENIKIQQVEVSIYNDDTTYFSSNERENSQGFNREQNKSKVVNVSEEAELGKENTAIDDSSLNMLI